MSVQKVEDTETIELKSARLRRNSIKSAYKNRDGGASREPHQNQTKIRVSSYSQNSMTSGSMNELRIAKNSYEYRSVDIDHTDDESAAEGEKSTEHTTSETKHKGDAGDFIKSIIFGGLDGIITLFAIVASISGSNLDVETVLVLGFAKLVGDGISMGVGDFLSEKAEIDFVKSENAREKWEFDNYKEGEVQEMIDIYKEKGIDEQDAKTILNRMSKYPDFFLQHMMMQELELDSGIIDDNPLKNGAVTFISFIIFGTVPLLSYLIFHGLDVNDDGTDWKFIIAIILTCVCLFIMGAVKGHYCNTNPIKSGAFILLNGALAAGSAYLIGWGLSEALGVHGIHA